MSYVGTLDVLSYPDSNNNNAEIFLNYIVQPKSIPAPLYYWRVIHDPERNEAVGFLGLNDPHTTDDTTHLLCGHVCDQLDWIDLAGTIEDWETAKKGQMTCCAAEDLKLLIDFAPDLSDGSGQWPTLMATGT